MFGNTSCAEMTHFSFDNKLYSYSSKMFYCLLKMSLILVKAAFV